MDIDTDFEQHRLDTFFTKEPETITWIEKVIKPNDILFDIGANIGVYSLYACAFFNKSIKVFSFEPVFNNFNKLCRNIILNNFEDNCSPYSIALGNQTKFDVINLASTKSGSASHIISDSPEFAKKDFTSKFKQGIFIITLDELINKHSFPCPNHIKIDVDGYEEHIINGAAEILKNNKLKSILLEVADIDNAQERISEIIINAGFTDKCPINYQDDHSRKRREAKGKGYIKNIIFTRNG